MPLSTERLQLLHRVAERGEDDARRVLASARQQLEQQTQIERELQRYLDEYQCGPGDGVRLSAALLENRRLFVQRLRAAVLAQANQVERTAAAMRQTEERWLESRRALRIAEQMREAGRLAEQRVEDSRAQRLQDDETLQRRAALGRAP